MEKNRLIILGGNGMLGREVVLTARNLGVDFVYTTRDGRKNSQTFTVGDEISELLDSQQPEAVINCIGLIKQRDVSDADMFRVNRDFPLQLAEECSKRNIRLVQISTDCVFSGKTGNYSENDTPDPIDAYGKSKLEGEITKSPHITIRTSVIGFEQDTTHSLLEWFLSQPEGTTIRGYKKAIWSGVTTQVLAPILIDLAIGKYKAVTGLLHIASEPISKFELLNLANDRFQKNLRIEQDPDFVVNRSLNHDKMDSLGIQIPSHKELIDNLHRK